jgi:hypothetical protein
MRWYVAAKNGISIREKPDVKSAVVGNILYGTDIAISYPDSTISISTEGLRGRWVQTTYGGKTGYIINSYLLPEPAPKAATKTMKEYLAQLSATAGPVLLVKRGSMNNVEEGGTETKKQLYRNGAEYHSVAGYEWNNDTYFLPGFTVEQGFILLRLLPEFKTVFRYNDVFPVKNGIVKKGEIEYDIRIDSETISRERWVKKIAIEFADGAVYTFEMFTLGNQLVISFGGGV